MTTAMHGTKFEITAQLSPEAGPVLAKETDPLVKKPEINQKAALTRRVRG